MNIRRYYVPNAIVFITQVVERRSPIFQNPQHLELLLTIIREAKERYPFCMLAYAFLPDHFHLLLKPKPPTTHTQIMHSIKPNFTKAYKQRIGILGPMKFWQKRYWDHVIRHEAEFATRLDYIHFNPVKHRLVHRPEQWPYSSYSAWQQRGAYPEAWGWTLPATLDGLELPEDA